MKKSLKLLAAAGAVLAMGSAHAINVGGVVWDPDSIFDFTTTDTMIETIVNPVIGGTIQGYAKITNLNGTGEAVFCPGCELTYKFSNYSITNIDPVSGALTFTGGQIDVYVDIAQNFDATLASTAVDGLLWLSLSGHEHVDGSSGLVGSLHSDPTPASAGVAGDGRGFLDVSGGLADTYFDTDTFAVLDDLLGTVGFADFLFTSSFQLLPGGNTFVSDDGVEYGLFGSNDLQGNSVVPEPATLALAGLALLGVGLSRRKFMKA